MAAARLVDIVADVNSLVSGFPFRFEASKEPFSFDLQPDTNIDQVYCLIAESAKSDPYLGYAQAQLDRLELRIARKFKRDPQATVRMLYADVSSLTSALTRAGRTGVEYSAEVVSWIVNERIGRGGGVGASSDTFGVASIDMLVDYDQVL